MQSWFQAESGFLINKNHIYFIKIQICTDNLFYVTAELRYPNSEKEIITLKSFSKQKDAIEYLEEIYNN